jgi:hypothetical protein
VNTTLAMPRKFVLYLLPSSRLRAASVPSYSAPGVLGQPAPLAASPAAYTAEFDTLCRYSFTFTPWRSNSTPAGCKFNSAISGVRPAAHRWADKRDAGAT